MKGEHDLKLVFMGHFQKISPALMVGIGHGKGLSFRQKSFRKASCFHPAGRRTAAPLLVA